MKSLNIAGEITTPMPMKEFYINLPFGATDQSISALIRHAASQLEKDVEGKQFQLLDFRLILPEYENDVASIYVRYKYKQKYKTNKDLVSGNSPTVKYKTSDSTLVHLTLSNIIEDFNSDYFRLLDELASEIKRISEKEILDIVFHQFEDNNIDVPYFSVYAS